MNALKQNRLKKNKGFSLVEVLIAMAILAFCAAPLLQAFVASGQNNAQARTTMNATTVAENLMEEIKAVGVESYGTDSGTTVSIGGKDLAVYSYSEPSYLYDGKTYQVEAVMTPSSEKYADASGTDKQFNAQEVTKLYSMDRETDAIYVQDNDELNQAVTDYVNRNIDKSWSTVEADTSTQYRFIVETAVTHGSIQDQVAVQVTYTSGGENLAAGGTSSVEKLFDSMQTGQHLKNLYIFYVPSSKENEIIIENRNNIPLQVYLVRQGSNPEPVKISVIENGILASGAKAYTQIRTNLDTTMLGSEITSISRNGDPKAMASAKDLFGLTALDEKTDGLTRLYSVEVTVKNQDGKQLAKLTGTALR